MRTYRGDCSVRQGNELSCPLNSCEKSGTLTILSSCTYWCCRKDPPQILVPRGVFFVDGKNRKGKREMFRIMIKFSPDFSKSHFYPLSTRPLPSFHAHRLSPCSLYRMIEHFLAGREVLIEILTSFVYLYTRCIMRYVIDTCSTD